MKTGNRAADQGDALRGCIQGLRNAFPDLSFDITNASQTRSETASTEWVMSATNAGSVNGLPPTGQPIWLAGVKARPAHATAAPRLTALCPIGKRQFAPVAQKDSPVKPDVRKI